MAGVIVSQGNLNPAAVQASGVYTTILPPPSWVSAQPTDVVCVTGGGSWGGVGVPTPNGSPQDFLQNHGGLIKNVSANDANDMATDANIAFQQASSTSSIMVLSIRVSDGTDVAANAELKDTTSGTALNGIEITAVYTGIMGNLITITITKGSKANCFNVSINSFSGRNSEFFPNIQGGSAGLFWTNLQTALTKGISAIRGPSQLVITGTPNESAIDPALGTFALAGGTDGRSGITSAMHIGQQAIGGNTGMYALNNSSVSPSLFWMAGVTDNTVFATVQAFADQQGMIALFPFATGTSTTAAITSKQTLGIDDPNVVFCKDFVYWYDPVQQTTRLVPPTAFMGGAIASLSPEQSPTNKPVFGVVATERTGTAGQGLAYSLQEIGELETNGIMIITNPINAGAMWGMWFGKNSSSDPVRSPIEYARLTNFLAKSITQVLGKYVGQLQTATANDPLEELITLEVSNFLQQLQDNKQIVAYTVDCSIDDNSFQSVAQHVCNVNITVTYAASVDFFEVGLQGGTTVQPITINKTTSALPQAA